MNVYELRMFAFISTMLAAFIVGSMYGLYRISTGAITLFDIWNGDEDE